MKTEIYTGKYLDGNTVINLGHAGLSIVRPYVGVNSKGQTVDVDHRIHLIVNDIENHFWPVIIKLTEDEVAELVGSLMRARAHDVSDSKEGYNTQLHEDVKSQEP